MRGFHDSLSPPRPVRLPSSDPPGYYGLANPETAWAPGLPQTGANPPAAAVCCSGTAVTLQKSILGIQIQPSSIFSDSWATGQSIWNLTARQRPRPPGSRRRQSAVHGPALPSINIRRAPRIFTNPNLNTTATTIPRLPPWPSKVSHLQICPR